MVLLVPIREQPAIKSGAPLDRDDQPAAIQRQRRAPKSKPTAKDDQLVSNQSGIARMPVFLSPDSTGAVAIFDVEGRKPCTALIGRHRAGRPAACYRRLRRHAQLQKGRLCVVSFGNGSEQVPLQCIGSIVSSSLLSLSFMSVLRTFGDSESIRKFGAAPRKLPFFGGWPARAFELRPYIMYYTGSGA